MFDKFAVTLSVLLYFGQGIAKPWQGDINFVIVKYGDESATPEMAAEFLTGLADYLKTHVQSFNNQSVHGWIANNPDSAKKILTTREIDFALVPPGFYLEHFFDSAQKNRPLLQIPRFGTNVEKYYLVTSNNGPNSLEDLKGQIVATQFAIDLNYLRKVVFPSNYLPNIFFKLKKSTNLADELFLLLEEMDAEKSVKTEKVTALLLDEELKQFFAEDEFVWPEIAVIWTSESLPRDLVVTMGLSERETKELKSAFLNMGIDPEGKSLLELMQSSGFSEVNLSLLNQITKKYFQTNR